MNLEIKKLTCELADEYVTMRAMYEKCGFKIHAEREGRIVMRKVWK